MILTESEVLGIKEYIGKIPTIYGADLFNFFIQKEQLAKQVEQVNLENIVDPEAITSHEAS